MEEVLRQFEASLIRPEQYLDCSDELKKECLSISEKLFTVCNDETNDFPRGPLSTLFTKGFDNEQIWEQVQLLNRPTISCAKQRLKGLESMGAHSSLLTRLKQPPTLQAEQSASDRESDGSEEEAEDMEEDSDAVASAMEDKVEPLAENLEDGHDRFFNLTEMNKFLQEEDRRYENRADNGDAIGRGDDGGIDLFKEMSSEEEDDRAKYDDFFDPPNNSPTHSASSSDLSEPEVMDPSGSGDEGVDLKDLSSHQKRQQKLKKVIFKLEEGNITAKPWQLTGEVGSHDRPANSLLEKVFTFDHMTRAAPIITEETTKKLEDIIKQRIIDEAWDDVERKVKPVEKPFDYSRARPLDQEKSSLSLAEVYEQEFLKQTQVESDEKEDKRQTEIKEMMKKLFFKLDALSNFHFTPKPPKVDANVVVSAPSLTVEEVTPAYKSDANLLAPEEAVASKGQTIGDTEKTKTDRSRERRKKKQRRKMAIKSSAARQKFVSHLNLGLGNKYSKKSALGELDTVSRNVDFTAQADKVDKRLKSSKAFFAHMQDEVSRSVKSNESTTKKKQRLTVSSSFLKL